MSQGMSFGTQLSRKLRPLSPVTTGTSGLNICTQTLLQILPIDYNLCYVDLQRIDQLSSLSWQDWTTGPKNAPTWHSICKSKYTICPSWIDAEPFLILLLSVNGEERGRGTGSKRHIAKNNAADEVLVWFSQQNS